MGSLNEVKKMSIRWRQTEIAMDVCARKYREHPKLKNESRGKNLRIDLLPFLLVYCLLKYRIHEIKK